jgi:hypothetical protein
MSKTETKVHCLACSGSLGFPSFPALAFACWPLCSPTRCTSHSWYSQDTQSAEAFLASDAKLKDDKAIHGLHAKYSKLASDDAVAKTVKALQTNGHTAVVVDTKEGEELFLHSFHVAVKTHPAVFACAAALKYLTELAPEGSTVWAGGSTTVCTATPQRPRYSGQSSVHLFASGSCAKSASLIIWASRPNGLTTSLVRAFIRCALL